MTKSKKIGLLWILAPIGFAIFLLMIGTFMNLIFAGSEESVVFRTFWAIAGFLGTVCSILIIIGLVIGMIFLVKKELDLNATYDERSGKGNNSEIPPEIKGWSWGGAFLTWIWGVANNVWLSLLSFIPFVSWIWWIVLGIKGKQWAWRSQKWQSVEHFKQMQRKWDKAGLVIFIINLIFLIAGLIVLIYNPQAYNYEKVTNPVINQEPVTEQISSTQSPNIILNLNSPIIDNENEIKLTLVKINENSADIEINYVNKDVYQGLRWDPRSKTVDLNQDFYSKVYEGTSLLEAAKRVYRDHLFCDKTPQLYAAENFSSNVNISEADFLKNLVGKPYNEILELAGGYGNFTCVDSFNFWCMKVNDKTSTYYNEHCDFGVIRFKEGEVKNGPPFNISLSKILNDKSVEIEISK